MKKLFTAFGVLVWYMLSAQQINRVEYFIDTDPGIGNGIALPITTGDSVEGIFSIPTTSLSVGMHTIYVRSQDASNQWSVFSRKNIFIQTPSSVQIVAAEYFIDTDPGFGNGTPITVTPGDSIETAFSIPTASLNPGIHTVYVRTLDALGKWSTYSRKNFFVQPSFASSFIVAAEYFVDTDPGFGNATPLTIIAGDSVDMNFTINTASLPSGMHTVYVRSRDNNGLWSTYSRKNLFIQTPNPVGIKYVEYFIDTDPGYGNATALTVTSGDSIDVNFNIPTGSLSQGFHIAYVRVLDSLEQWSVYSKRQFYVYPEPEPIVYAEYHIDNLSAYGTGTSLNITPGDSVQQNFQVPTNLLTLGWHKIYVTVKDAADNWSVFSKDSFLVDAFNCPIYNNGEIALVGDTCKGSQITFNDLVTYNTSENTNDYTREWDFFDDGTVDFSGESVNYTFNQTGTFTVKLRTYLTSSPLCSETVYKTFTIRNVDTTNLNVSICDGQSHFAGGGNQTVQGIYYDVKPNRWGCDSVIITNLTVIPNVTPSVSIVASQTSFCSGSYVQFDATPTNGGTNPYYQWKVNGTIVSQGYGWQGYTSYGTYGLADDDIVTVELTSNETCTTVNPAVSNGIQVSVTPSVSASITISVDNNDFCAGTTVNFSVTNTTNPGSNPQYAWYINNILQVETGTTLSRSNFSGGEQVRCYLTSDATCVNNSPVSSNIITMTVYPNGAPDVSISRNNNNICFGTQVVFTAATSYGGSNPNYQWFLNGVSVQNGASNQYSNATLDDEDSIAVVLTSDYQCRTATYDTSNSFIMDVFYSTPVTLSLSVNDTDICDGQTAAFAAMPSPFYGGETYTWYRNNQVVQSGTSRFFTSTSLADKDSVWVVLDATPLPCATGIPVKSDTVHFTVTPNVTAGISIVESVNNICAGTNVTFTATPTNPGTNPTYAWFVNNNYQPGFTGNTFATTGLSNGVTVTASLTSSIECVLNNPAHSNGIVMNVTSVLLPEVSITTPITTICEGTEVSFTATVSNEGNNPTIEWLINNSVVQTGGLTFTSEDLENLNNVRVRLTSDYACPQTNPVLSNQIQMTVYDSVTPTVFLSYGPNPACVGNLITLFATPSFPGSNPTYTFYKNGNVVQSGSQTQYTSSNFNDGDDVYVVLESDANCARTTTATSNTEAISIVQFAQATVSIQATTAQCVGSSITFTATGQNAGSNPIYTWKVNNAIFQSSGSNIFNTNAVNNGDVVVCEMNSSLGCVSNNPAVSNSITVQFNSVVTPSVDLTASVNNVCQGTNIIFTAAPTNGGSTPNYIFRRNSNIVQNSTSNVYATANLLNNDVISVEMTSSEGCVSVNPVSDNVIVILNQCSQANVVLSAASSVCEGDDITLTAIPTNGGQTPSYEFFVDGNSVYSGASNQYIIQNAQDGSYSAYVVMTSSEPNVTNNPATSNTVQVTVNNIVVPTVSIAPSMNNVCQSEYIVFTASTANTGNNPSYAWYINGNFVQQNNQPELGGYFGTNDTITLVLTSNAVCAQPSQVAAGFRLNLIQAVTPSVDLAASINNTCPGTPITFTATPTNGGSTPTYIFRRNNAVVQSGNDNTFTTAALQHNDVISVELSSSESCVTSTTASDAVTVLFTQCQQVEVGLSVSSSSVCVGDDITLTAFPTNGGQSPSYEFFVNGFSVYSGSQNQFTINAAQAGVYSAYVVLTSSETNVTNNPATSNTVQVTVNNIVVPTVSIAPSMNNVCQSEYIVFTASTTNAGNNPSYAWYINGNFVQQNNQPELGGYFGTNDTITLVLTSNAVCAQPSQVAAGFRLNLIQAVTPSVDLVASINNTCPGTSITFTATPTNGGSTPTYIFRRNNAVVQSGNDNTFTTAALQHNDIISVELSSSESCVTSTTASDAVTILFTQCQQVEVGLSVSSSSVCVGDDITLTAFPTNGGQTPSYEFFVNGFSVYSGSQNQFTINASQAGVYSAYVVLTSSETNVTNNPATSNTVQVTVNNIVVPTVTVFASANNVCENQYITLTTNVTNGGNNPNYAWYINGGFVQFNNQPELGGYFSNNDTVTVVVTSNAVCAQPNSVATGFRFNLIPDVTPSVSITADNNNFCYGTAATFTATPTNGGSTSEYAWYVDGALMQTGSNNTFTSSVLENGDDVYVVITSSETCVTNSTASSNAIAMNVTYYQTPSVSIINNYGNAVCLNDVVTYTASPSNGGTNPTYEWFVNGFSVQNSNINELTVPAAQVGQYEVYVILTSTYPCLQTATATSSTANLTVSTALTPDISIVSNTTEICPGGTVVFEVWSTTNGGLTPSYQWLVNNDPVSGAQGTTFSPNNLQDGDVVSCEFTSSFSCAVNNPDTSNTIKIIVAQNAIASVSISVNNNPYCEGSSSVTFFANAVNDGNAPDYEWYLNGNLAASGVNASSYTLNNPADEDSVYVYMVSNDACVASVNQAVYSNGIELEELPTVAVSASIVATVNNVCPGESVSFTTTAVNGGNNTTYVWNVNGQDVQFNNNETYTAILNDGDDVYVKVFSSETCPSHYPAISNTVEVITNSANCTNPVSVAINASANTICEGTAVTFTSNAANEGTAPNYNWYVNGSSVQNGSSSELVYTFNNDGQYTVYVVLTSSESNVSNNPATSNTQVVVVNNQVTPSASIVANSSGICAGENLSFTASTTHAGVSPTFDWYVNGNLVQSSVSNTFSSTNFVDGDEVYVVLNSTASCVTAATATSNIIEVQVNQLSPPTVQVVANPAVAVCPNTSVTYSTTSVNGGNNPTFEWYVNGTFVSSNTTYQYTPNDDDSVSVVMTSNSLCASVPTAVNHVNMTVGLILQAGVSITSVNAGVVCENTTKTFIATPVNGGSNPQYEWQVNGSTVSTAGASFTATNLVAGDEVSVILTSNNTCVSNTVATSNIITISVLPYLEPDVLISATAYDVCEGATVTYTASPVNGGSNPAYAWYVDGVLVSNNIVYSYAPQQGDTVSVVMTTSYECPTEPTSSNNIFPTIYPEPVASFTADIDTSTMVEFFNQVDANTTYIWFFGDGATASYLSNPIHVYSSGNYYTVTLVAINPCGSDTMTQVITVEPIPTNIVESDILFESVKLYPNPAERFVNINLELVQSAELQLTWHDALGRIVYAENMAAVKGSNTQRFDMSNFAKGVYTLSIRNEQYSITKRLVLQ